MSSGDAVYHHAMYRKEMHVIRYTALPFPIVLHVPPDFAFLEKTHIGEGWG